MEFKIGVVIDRPVDVVVKAILNPENAVHWTTDLERFEVLSGNPGEVGSIARLHYLQKGRRYVMEDKLIDCIPGEKYVSQVTGDALTARVEISLRSMEHQTGMFLSWTGKGKILTLKILLPLMKGKIIKHAKKDLDTFKRLVETKGSIF